MENKHPYEDWFRQDRMPHIWCPGCGIGIAVHAFIRAAVKSGIDRDKIVVVSGIGCTGRVAGYIRLDSYHVTHGRAIPFATGLKLANPSLTVVVFSGDGDIIAIGGNHLIHAARRNIDMLVICVNNSIYGMTGGQVSPTTLLYSYATTSPYGNTEPPFNLPFLADSCGAVFVARWTTYHPIQLTNAITKALKKKGFKFIEVISSCPSYFGRLNKIPDGIDMMKIYKEKAKIKNNEDTRNVTFEDLNKEFIVGNFVDKEMPDWLDMYNEQIKKQLGEKYKYVGCIR